jgi:glycosyltransferase involved in cell wall biosynthesis
MKLCFICCEYPPAKHGGIGSVTQVLGRALVAAGHEVRVIGVYSSLEGLAEVEEDCGVQVVRLKQPKQRLGWTFGRQHLYQTVSRWASRGEIDLVEVPDWEGYAAGWPSLRVPVVTRLHGSSSYFAREMHAPLYWPAFCLEALSFHRADFCCSTSAYTAARTQKLFGPRRRPAAVLFNPVELPAPGKVAPRQANKVVFAGTLTPKKGVVSLIKAWPDVARGRSDAELHLFGKDAGAEDGRPMRELLESLLPSDFAATVHFHGHVSRERILAEFQTCRAAVFPSYAEAFSVAPLEAMAQGCPVVFSQRCSGPELIDDGRNGLLIDPDATEQISESLLRLLRDDDLCARLGAAGKRVVEERFACDVLAARNEAFYADCISRQ